MRIFYAVANSPNSKLRSNLWRKNLRESLVKLGHTIVDFEYDLDQTFQKLDPSDPIQSEFIEQNRPRLSDALLSQVQDAHSAHPIDVLFTYFYNACVLPDVIREIRSLGIVAINWFCNASYQFHLVSEIAPAYDYCLVPEKFRLPDYRQIGARPIYCQEAANPDVYRPYSETESYEAGFVGQAYGERPDWIAWLAERGRDVRVWGYGWENFAKRRPSLNPRRWGRKDGSPRIPKRLIGGILTDEEMVQTFSRTKVNLGFAACWTAGTKRISQVRLRDFEVPMSGGFYITEYQDEIPEFFEIDSEIVCYRDREELFDKIKFYVGHPELRDKIRQAGRHRCLNEHTWAKRFERVFHTIGLEAR
ncbi:MAG TPA: glycosyltransferase [Chthoniobacterales bacterium]|nr:glycosyltransferase [Chthoniobacterales bacterium]